MKSITKKLVAISMIFAMCFVSVFGNASTLSVEAKGSLSEASEKAEKATEDSKGLFETLGFPGAFDTFFDGVQNIAEGISNGIGGIKSIAEYFGFIQKEPTQEDEILEKLSFMDEKMDELNNNLNGLIESFNSKQIHDNVKDRLDKATASKDRWKKFANYAETMQDDLVSYQMVINDAFRVWCENLEETARYKNGIDNRDIYLLYDNENGEPKTYVSKGAPKLSDYENGAYIVLKSALFPTDMNESNFDMNTARSEISESIKTKLYTAFDKESSDAPSLDELIEVHNFDNLTIDGFNKLDAYNKVLTLNKLCDDFYSILMHRITLSEMRATTSSGFSGSAATFAGKVMQDFKHFCDHIVGDQEGIEEYIKSLSNVYNFEGEISENVNNMTAALVVDLDKYAAFSLDIMGKIPSAKESDAYDIAVKWEDTLNKIIAIHSKYISGYSSRCYLTNSILKIVPITIYRQGNQLGSEKNTKTYIDEQVNKDKVNYLDENISRQLCINYQYTKKNENPEYIKYLQQYLDSYSIRNDLSKNVKLTDDQLVVSDRYFYNTDIKLDMVKMPNQDEKTLLPNTSTLQQEYIKNYCDRTGALIRCESKDNNGKFNPLFLTAEDYFGYIWYFGMYWNPIQRRYINYDAWIYCTPYTNLQASGTKVMSTTDSNCSTIKDDIIMIAGCVYDSGFMFEKDPIIMKEPVAYWCNYNKDKPQYETLFCAGYTLASLPIPAPGADNTSANASGTSIINGSNVLSVSIGLIIGIVGTICVMTYLKKKED